MCYIDDSSTQSLMDLGDFDTHLYTKFCIQVGERLSLSTGKSLRFTIKKFVKVKDSCCFTNCFVDLVLRNFTKFQSECHVIIYCHMRIQSVVLEYHCDITVFRLYIVHNFVTNL